MYTTQLIHEAGLLVVGTQCTDHLLNHTALPPFVKARKASKECHFSSIRAGQERCRQWSGSPCLYGAPQASGSASEHPRSTRIHRLAPQATQSYSFADPAVKRPCGCRWVVAIRRLASEQELRANRRSH